MRFFRRVRFWHKLCQQALHRPAGLSSGAEKTEKTSDVLDIPRLSTALRRRMAPIMAPKKVIYLTHIIGFCRCNALSYC